MTVLFSLVWRMWEIKRDNNLSQVLVHFVFDRVNLFIDQRISSFPTRGKFSAFQKNLKAYFWQFSHGFYFFFLEMMIVNAWSGYFVELLSRLTCQFATSFHTDLPCSGGNCGFTHFSVIDNNIFVHFTLFLSKSQVCMIKEWCWLSQINVFECFLHRINFSFFPPNLMSSTYTDKNNRFSLKWESPSQPYFNRTFSNCLTHNSPAQRWPYRFLSRGGWVFHTGPWFGPFVSWQTNPSVWTLRFWNPQQFVSIFHCGLGCKPILHLLLVHRNPTIWRWYTWF